MGQLFVEAEKIARARDLARNAAQGVQAFIDRHTTVSIDNSLHAQGAAGLADPGWTEI